MRTRVIETGQDEIVRIGKPNSANRKLLIGMATERHGHKVRHPSFDCRNAPFAESLGGLWYPVGISTIRAQAQRQTRRSKTWCQRASILLSLPTATFQITMATAAMQTMTQSNIGCQFIGLEPISKTVTKCEFICQRYSVLPPSTIKT